MVTTRHHPEEFPSPSTPPSKQEDVSAQPNTQTWRHAPSTLLIAWLSLSVWVVIWDALYCLLRPHSMPGGKWHIPWTPYALYGAVDYTYGWPAFNARNGFTSGQAAMNLVECVVYICYLGLVWKYGQTAEKKQSGKAKKDKKSVGWFFTQRKVVDGRAGAVAVLAVFSACVMTVSKTALYWLCELFAEFDNIGHNDLWTLVFLWIVPNGLWIIIPGIASYAHGLEIVRALEIANRASGSTRPKSS